VIPEPLGGAHRDPKAMAERIQHYVVDWVRELSRIDPDTLVRKRFEKFRSIGSVR
jgi:acetyl-CoA carboxylase carboxyl transferase subunit alpha